MSQASLTTYFALGTEFYDLELASRPDAAEALAFYQEYALMAQGTILEPMCGSGRFLIPMLQAGCCAEGFDASLHMLEAFKQRWSKLSREQSPVWQAYVQDFANDKRYVLIFVPFGSWGLITDVQESQRCLKKMYDHLVPGGTLLLEIETTTSVPQPTGVWHHGEQQRADGSLITVDMLPHYDVASQLFTAECRYASIVNEQVVAQEVEFFEQYLYRHNEMDYMLGAAGFTIIKKYSNYQKTIVRGTAAPVVIYECKK